MSTTAERPRPMIAFSVIRVVALSLLGLFTLSGCSHYRLGTESRPEFDSLFIAPVINRASTPQAVAIVTTRLRETFLRDGRVPLASSADDADAVLEITLVSYRRDSLTLQPGDTGLTRKFGVTLTAHATLRDPASDKVWFKDRVLRVERQLFTDGGQQLQAEYQLVPLLAESLADRARAAVLDTW